MYKSVVLEYVCILLCVIALINHSTAVLKLAGHCCFMYVGYTLRGPDNPADSVPVQNTTSPNSFGLCYLSCPFNSPENITADYDDIVIQPCYYAVNITEVIKGNYFVRVTYVEHVK